MTNEAIETGKKAKTQKSLERLWPSVALFAASLILPPKGCSYFTSLCTNMCIHNVPACWFIGKDISVSVCLLGVLLTRFICVCSYCNFWTVCLFY